MDTFQLTGWKAINYIANLYVATMRLLTAQSARQSISQPSDEATQATLSQSMASAGWVVPGSPVLSLSLSLSLVSLFSSQFLWLSCWRSRCHYLFGATNVAPKPIRTKKTQTFFKAARGEVCPPNFCQFGFHFPWPFWWKVAWRYP